MIALENGIEGKNIIHDFYIMVLILNLKKDLSFRKHSNSSPKKGLERMKIV